MSEEKNKGEVFPTYAVPVQSGSETFRPMTWGLVFEPVYPEESLFNMS